MRAAPSPDAARRTGRAQQLRLPACRKVDAGGLRVRPSREKVEQVMQTDEQLMEQYLDGSRQAFAILHARYEPLVRRLVMRNVFRQADADDLVQQTFTQLHAARTSFRRGDRLKPWVCTVARNVCRDHGRRRRRRPEVGHEMDDLSSDQPAFLPGELNEWRAPLAAALAKLSAPTQQIFQQHFLEERALADIARDLDTNPSTVRVRLHRGFHQLRTTIAASSQFASSSSA